MHGMRGATVIEVRVDTPENKRHYFVILPLCGIDNQRHMMSSGRCVVARRMLCDPGDIRRGSCNGPSSPPSGRSRDIRRTAKPVVSCGTCKARTRVRRGCSIQCFSWTRSSIRPSRWRRRFLLPVSRIREVHFLRTQRPGRSCYLLSRLQNRLTKGPVCLCRSRIQSTCRTASAVHIREVAPRKKWTSTYHSPSNTRSEVS